MDKTEVSSGTPTLTPDPILRSRRFMPLMIANILGGFNDNLLKNALLVLVTYGFLTIGGLRVEIALPIAATIFTLPFFLFSAIAGQVADKYDRAWVLRRVKFCEILIALIASLGYLTGNIWLLLLALFCIGLQSCFFTPTRNAVLPQWLRDEELVTGNGIINGLLFVFILLGTVCGTIIITQVFGPQLVSALLVGCALLGWLVMCQAPDAPPPAPDMRVDYNIVTATARILREAWANKPVIRPLLGTAWFWGLSALVMTLIPTYLEGVLYYDNVVLMVLMIAFTLGAFTGSIACTILAGGKDAIWISALGALCLGLFCSDLFMIGQKADYTLAFSPLIDGDLGGLKDFWAAPRSARFVFDLFGAAASAGLFVVPLQALAQRRADPQYRARLLCAGAIINAAATSSFQISLLLLPAFNIPLHVPFLIIGILSALIGLYAMKRAFAPEHRAPISEQI